jgi:hypothetical protein
LSFCGRKNGIPTSYLELNGRAKYWSGDFALERGNDMREGIRSRRAQTRKLLMLLVLCFGLRGQAVGQGLDTTEYFPLRVGNTYTYCQSLPCPPDTVTSRYCPWGGNLVGDTAFINGRKYFITVVAGFTVGTDTVRVDSVGNMIVRHSGPEQVFYKFNAAVGDTWEYRVVIGGREYIYNVTLQSRSDTVRVHAGTFANCLRFFFDVPGMIDEEFTNWLAPNVGLVFRCVQEPLELYEATVNGIHYPGITSVWEERNPIAAFALYQNYPNPFNPSTVISYQLPVRSFVSLKIYDLLGREVETLVSEGKSAGDYAVKWNAMGFASGVYIARLTAGNYVASQKLLLMK